MGPTDGRIAVSLNATTEALPPHPRYVGQHNNEATDRYVMQQLQDQYVVHVKIYVCGADGREEAARWK